MIVECWPIHLGQLVAADIQLCEVAQGAHLEAELHQLAVVDGQRLEGARETLDGVLAPLADHHAHLGLRLLGNGGGGGDVQSQIDGVLSIHAQLEGL